jgi:hypothetical protein
MKRKLVLVFALSAAALLIVSAVVAGSPMGTDFTYQGFLKSGGTPATGAFDFEFRLFDTATGGAQVGSLVAHDDVPVTNGLFVVQLDFGADAFTGDARWLEIGVSADRATISPTLLSPRQALTPAPYALHAGNADTVDGLHASDLLGGDVGWALTGNAGTDPAANFIGTSDNVTFTVRVSNTNALRIVPNTTSPNLIGGYGGNWVTNGVFGATIAGGGQSGDLFNRATDHWGVIGGGQNNQVGDDDADPTTARFATVGGGGYNTADGGSATIAGGWGNTASGADSTIGGGSMNIVTSTYATISGGRENTAGGVSNAIGGGLSNSTSGDYATVAGGLANRAIGEWYPTVGGGAGNTASGIGSTVPGGRYNLAEGRYSFAAGFGARAIHDGAFVWADFTSGCYDSTAEDQFAVRATGGVTFNTGTAPFEINGNLSVQGNADTPPGARGFTTTATLDDPRAVAVAGQYAYVPSANSNSLSIFDISNPDSITARGVITTGLDAPVAVAVAGRYAYVASWSNNSLAVFDVSDPDNIVAPGAVYVDRPNAVTLSGRYVYVVSNNNDRLSVFDVSNPTTPIALGYTTSNLDQPFSVFVAGRYAYVASRSNDRLAIFDISDPNTIVTKGYTSTNLSGPTSVVVSGRHAYVTSWGNGLLAAFDVFDPDNPVALSTISTNLDEPWSVAVAGRYAYVTSRNNDSLAVFDVSDPTNLVALGFTSANLDDPQSVFIAGRYAYVASTANDRLAVFDLNHLEAPTADIGSLRTGGLHVGESAIVGNNLTVQDGLNVGGSALINGDVSVQGDLFAHVSVTTVTGSTTLVTAQSGVVLVNNAAAATITLPAAASSGGLTFTIKRLTANAVTVASAEGTIDGAATQALAAQYDFITVVSDGTAWYITGR